MRPRSVTLRRPRLLFIVALFTPLYALAQTAGTQGAPAQSVAPQTAQSQAAPSQAAGSQATPSPIAQSSTAAAQPTAIAPQPTTTTPQPATTSAQPAATASAPSAPAYDIEIVIFRAKATLGQPENWTAETASGATVAGGEASSGSGSVGKLLTVLPSSDYHLGSIEARLRTSGTYLPVAHAAWVQTASAWGTHAGFPLASLGINVPGLAGVISLERGVFLHLGMTLSYTMQDPPSGLNAPPGTTFVMNETRRVRFYQRNYYDHPAFGVIALITPARGPRPPGR